jgi:V-type H+-transporting ATPase subunit a
MKISMIVAFFHMGFGMALKIINERKRGEYKKIIYDSLPKIGLLFTTVGYLVFLIVKKWTTDYSGIENTAPSIINTLL